jgi:tetratricopeptide (TPR) repeat protein
MKLTPFTSLWLCRRPLIFGRLIAVLLAYTFFTGCMDTRHIPRDMDSSPPAVEQEQPQNSYYHYTQSQIALKENRLDQAIEQLSMAVELDPETPYLQVELAQLYLRKKDSPKALDILDHVLIDYPQNVPALILQGNINQNMKNVEAAAQAYEKAIALDAQQERVYLMLGGIYLDAGDHAAAFRVYSQLVELFPGSYAGRFFLGKIYAGQGKRDEAEAEFKKALELEPELEEARIELLQIYKTDEDDEKVLRMYREILEYNPDNVEVFLELALFYHTRGSVQESEQMLISLGAKSSQEPEILRKVVSRYLDPKKYDESVIILQGMLAGDPESSNINYLLGVAYDGQKLPEKSLRHLKKVKDDSRFFENAVVHITAIYQEEGNIDKALAYLESVVERHPDNTAFLLYMGSLYEEKKQFELAEKMLLKGLSIDPEHIRLRFRLGVVYDKWQRKTDSIREMKRVIELDPENASALNYLGYTYADMGIHLEEAEALIKAAMKHKPDDGYITDSLGWVYFKMGRYAEALRYLQTAAQLTPDDPIIMEHVGDAYARLNDTENAEKYYRLSLEKGNTDPEVVKQKIENLKSGSK